MTTLTHDFHDGRGPVPAHQHLYGGGWVADSAHVDASVRVTGDALVYGNARVTGDAQVYGNAQVSGDAQVSGNAEIRQKNDMVAISSIGSENGTLTLFRCKKGKHTVSRGCFADNLSEFYRRVKEKDDNDPSKAEYLALRPFLELKIASFQTEEGKE